MQCTRPLQGATQPMEMKMDYMKSIKVARALGASLPGRPLTKNQLAVLQSMLHFGGYPGCVWEWDNYSASCRLLDTLVERRLIVREGDVATRRLKYRVAPDVLARAKALADPPKVFRVVVSFELDAANAEDATKQA